MLGKHEPRHATTSSAEEGHSHFPFTVRQYHSRNRDAVSRREIQLQLITWKSFETSVGPRSDHSTEYTVRCHNNVYIQCSALGVCLSPFPIQGPCMLYNKCSHPTSLNKYPLFQHYYESIPRPPIDLGSSVACDGSRWLRTQRSVDHR
jgi:hypothetical protein